VVAVEDEGKILVQDLGMDWTGGKTQMGKRNDEVRNEFTTCERRTTIL
jgi:hypothetical protein